MFYHLRDENSYVGDNMADIWGTIISIRELFENADTKLIMTSKDGTKDLVFKKGRKYIIPAYQREIRWTSENVIELVDDIQKGKSFIGNVILTKRNDGNFEIVDGQQRMTTIYFLLKYIDALYGNKDKVFDLCDIQVDNLKNLNDLISVGFDESQISQALQLEIEENDFYHQRQRYQEIWKRFSDIDALNKRGKRPSFIKNLERCTVNVIAHSEDSTNYGIEYFIDVNLKGLKLDAEDIFKGYLFSGNMDQEMQDSWNIFKKKTYELNSSGRFKDIYPLETLLSHYFYCDLPKHEEYEQIEFNSEFRLTKDIIIEEEKFYSGQHIVTVINDYSYMLGMLKKLTAFLEFTSQVLNNESPSESFKTLLKGMDDTSIKIYYGMIRDILLDSNKVPKIFLMKYYLEFVYGNEKVSKGKIKYLLTIYTYIIFFNIFQINKNIAIIQPIIRNKEWIKQLYCKIKEYCSLPNISVRQTTAQFKMYDTGESIDERFRSRALAIVYNYLRFDEQNKCIAIRDGSTPDLYQFTVDHRKYSLEHFIINNSDQITTEKGFNYTYRGIARYRDSVFNFMFVEEELNSKVLRDHAFWEKIKLLRQDQIKCPYSKMIFEIVGNAFSEYPKTDDATLYDGYFSHVFQREYGLYVANVVKAISERLNTQDE